MSKRFKKIWNICTSVITGLAVLLVVALVGVRIVGITPLIVISGSMEPVIPTGSIIYIKDTSPSDLKVGDTVTFTLASASLEAPDKMENSGGGVDYGTHQIIDIDRSDPTRTLILTKGTANDNADGWIDADRVVGKYLFHLPGMGFVATYIQSPTGRGVTIGAGVLLVIAMFTPDLIAWIFKDEKGEGESEGESHDATPEAVADGAEEKTPEDGDKS